MYYGSEFTSRILDLWAYHNQVTRVCSRPGKPTDNGHIASFNGRLRDECLNVYWFRNISDATGKLEAWRRGYNDARTHRGLNDLTPNEFAAQQESWSQKAKP
jgi:putative transposase